MTAMNTDPDLHSNDLTQLSSREQLSALMDGALPEDQTRFLLRRLQHDAELAGSWERWRIASDVMRGLAPARHLPADFASRVSAALHGETADGAQASTAPRPAWLRRSAGLGAIAAALAVVALMARPALAPEAAPAPARQVAAVPPARPAVPLPKPPAPVPQADAPNMLAAAAAVAVAKPVRRSKPRSAAPVALAPETTRIAAATPSAAERDVPATEFPALPPADIVTRPWPRSILSQYGNSGSLTVGFGEHLPRAAENPFTPSAFRAPPKLLSDPAPAQDAAASATPPQP